MTLEGHFEDGTNHGHFAEGRIEDNVLTMD